MEQTIKLKRSSAAAKIPSASDLELGELALNTKDGRLFTKKDDGTVIDLSTETGGTMWEPTKHYKPGDWITTYETLGSGKVIHEEFGCRIANVGKDPRIEANHHPVTGSWGIYNVIKYLSQDVTYTIGSSATADFPTLSDGLKRAGLFKMLNGAKITFEIESGFIEPEGLILFNLSLGDTIINHADGTFIIDAGSTGCGIYLHNTKLGEITCDLTITGIVRVTGTGPSAKGCNSAVTLVEDSYIDLDGLTLDIKTSPLTDTAYAITSVASTFIGNKLTITSSNNATRSGYGIVNCFDGSFFDFDDVIITAESNSTDGTIFRITSAMITAVRSQVTGNYSVFLITVDALGTATINGSHLYNSFKAKVARGGILQCGELSGGTVSYNISPNSPSKYGLIML